MNPALIVQSAPDGSPRFQAEIRATGIPVRFASVAEAETIAAGPSSDLPPSVYFRSGFGDELRDEVMVRVVRVEEAFRARGLRMLNRVIDVMRSQRKDIVYERLGDLCPPAIPNPTAAEALAFAESLPSAGRWPILYRAADLWGSKGLVLCRAADELRAAVRRGDESKLRTMVVQWIDTRGPDGLHRKHRGYVIDGEIDTWAIIPSAEPVVKNIDNCDEAAFIQENRDLAIPERARIVARRISDTLSLPYFSFDAVGPSLLITDVNSIPYYGASSRLFPPAIARHREGHHRRFVEYLYRVSGLVLPLLQG